MVSKEYTLTPSVFFHPGEDLAEKLQEMDLSVEEFAKQAHVPESVVKDIIEGKASISADMALAFESVTQIPAKYWIRMQHHYDEYILTQKNTSYMERLQKLFCLPRNVAAIL